MKYYSLGKNFIIDDITDFSLEETLECGQVFRFEKCARQSYDITALGRTLHAEQNGDTLTLFDCNESEFKDKWCAYFDLGRDYARIKSQLVKGDEIMTRAVAFAGGIHLLNQQPYECLLSFIISQNNNIPRIKGIISAMCDKYGKDGSFPDLSQLKNVTERELFDLKTGFRSKYIFDAIRALDDGRIDLAKLYGADTDTARQQLMKIKGVGPKVADCVLLFSLGHRDVFPIDVWVKRIMCELYFNGKEQSLKAIAAFAKNKWGALAGYAQQYLFYYARSGRAV